MELDLPLDLRGMAALWVHGGHKGRVVLWHAPWLREEDPLPPSLLNGLSPIRRMRLLRLLSLDGAAHGPWLAQAAGTAARLGRHRLAWNLMTTWLAGELPCPNDATEARRLLDVERERIKTVLSWKREWPEGVIHLDDFPAWLVLPAIRQLRRMGRKGSFHLISGGHLLKAGRWTWYIPAGSWRPSKVSVERPELTNHSIPHRITSAIVSAP